MFGIDFFKTAEGKSPVAEYLDGLDAKQAAKVLWTLSAINLTQQRLPLPEKDGGNGRSFRGVRDLCWQHIPPA